MGFRTRPPPPPPPPPPPLHHHLLCSRTCSSPRIKREDQSLLPHHDSLFSEWKILVGPTDWEKYFSGTEGSERYRTQNVKGAPFCPGVYELALCSTEFTKTNGTRFSAQFKKDTLVVVYVGQAENLYSRLQEYGRTGSHLETGGGGDYKCGKSWKPCGNTSSSERSLNGFTCQQVACDCPRLFTKAFAHGYPIAFRWTPTKCRTDALAIEAGLLKCFDYAWNRGSNRERRPNDAFMKLQQKTGKLKMKSVIKAFSKKLWKSNKVNKDLPGDERSNLLDALPWQFHAMKKETVSCSLECANSKSNKKTNLSEPTGTATYRSSNGAKIVITSLSWEPPEKGDICGVIDGNGMVCKEAPVYGRKRCGIHKGMRVQSNSRVSVMQWKFGMQKEESFVKSMASEECTQSKAQVMICGVFDANGIVCNEAPVLGRKRCDAHKGMRIQLGSTVSLQNICGIVDANNGFPCKERPLSGRKRCEAHKGMKLRIQ